MSATQLSSRQLTDRPELTDRAELAGTETAPPAPARKPGRVGRRVFLTGAAAALAGAGATGGWALNRYVVDHVEVANTSQQVATGVTAATADSTGTSTATTSL